MNRKAYIGTKIIKAKPMSKKNFYKTHPDLPPPDIKDAEGYLVVYPDGYESWSPKTVFEAAYREITDDEINIISSNENCLRQNNSK